MCDDTDILPPKEVSLFVYKLSDKWVCKLSTSSFNSFIWKIKGAVIANVIESCKCSLLKYDAVIKL